VRMQSNSLLLWWYLGILTAKRYEALIQYYGDLETSLEVLTPMLLKELGVKEKTITETLQRMEEFDAEALRKDMDERGVTLLFIEDEDYPASLKEIGDAPVFLSYKGDLSVLCHPMLSIVGTRNMSAYGRRVVREFVPVFVQSGLTTVSGLALGIDAAVAQETLLAGGRTVAVLGHGLNMLHPPSNKELSKKIIDAGGLILSEYPLYQQPNVYTFPARNRIIAGLSRGTLVIEAPMGSGSIITADLALEYNREVFAVPGQIFDEHMNGCHALIAAGHARITLTPDDVLREIGIIPSEQTLITFTPQSDDERIVHGALTAVPQTMDDLVASISIPAARIGTALTMMELAGAAWNIGGGQWVRR